MGLAVFAWIDSIRQQSAGFIAALAGQLEANVGIDAQANPLVLALDAVFETPPLAPTGGNFKVEAFLVRQLEGFLAGLGGADRSIGEGHLGATPAGGVIVAPTCPRNAMALFSDYYGRKKGRES